jgi:hypothetical protein
MSPFISSMPAPGLIEMPPLSKTTPLPTKATGRSFGLPPFHCMIAKPRRPHGALRHAEQRAHAELLHFRFGEDFDFDAELFQLLRLGREFDRTEDVRRAR